MGNLNATRVLVTDESGKVLYDNMEEDSAMGAVCGSPRDRAGFRWKRRVQLQLLERPVESKAATPILYAGSLIGAVYMMEYDLDQGALISALQYNIFWISVILEGAVILFP